ncbi:Mur ligase family protein [Marihabitans asiaticum]|uniref:Lipid II isoglutaminyl synthase (glutamine-hydrolyzing) subunit MurT n=1 Tax=Marihabitans asiaticum TaxID=415218 RepID=A0A560WCY2_9MICO|nr:Mur ligase family protein [Marihabitans asiaticum]TWD15543.1 UDP-N-acetylmuramyl tripeptide synthase [Marihabitans asiaticum]
MLRTTAAVIAGKAARTAARVRGGGTGGSALPGLVAEKVDPGFLAHALRDVPQVVVVSGTNGKTTTTKMLVALLRAHGRTVFTNPTGSNFTRGVISAMLAELPLRGRLHADLAVLELDEAHALHFARAVAPTHALLLNVARDQLDRFAEIDHTAGLLTELAGMTTDGVVLNRDDPYVNRIAGGLRDGVAVRWFGLDAAIHDRLGELAEHDAREQDDFEAPPAGAEDGLLEPVDESAMGIRWGAADDAERLGPVTLRQRGLAAMINATAATTTARMLLGAAFEDAAAERALRTVAPPFGRGEVIDADGQPLELVLVKNPAGFTVALGTYGSTPVASMIAINDDYADGRDVSWLYDVDFSELRAKGVALTSGVRGWDMALRLQYDDVPVGGTETDLGAALGQFLAEHAEEPKRIFCTYTAMLALRRMLAERYDVPEMGTEVEEGAP